MNVRITFADGTSEERNENSPAIPHFADPPSFLYVGYHEGRIVTGHTTELSCLRGYRARAWCITGGREDGELLRGVWRECKVESLEEQAARLAAERDRAAKMARLWKQYAKSEHKMGRMVGDIKARMNVLIIDLAAAVGSRLPDGAGIWTSDLLDKAKALYAERDAARCALQDLLDDCATWRAHRGATGMGAHLPHDLMSATPSVVQHIERAAKRGLGQ